MPMKSLSYYSYTEDGINSFQRNSKESHDSPLIVNCAGNFVSSYPLTTDNEAGRLDYYIMHLTSGSLTTRFGDERITVLPGQTLIFPPRYHYYYSYDGRNGPLSYYWVHFTGSHVPFYLSRLGFSTLPGLWVSSADDRQISGQFHTLFDHFTNESPYVEDALSATLLQILVMLAQNPQGDGRKNPILRSLRYIHNNYTEKLRIPELAAMENLSNSRYCVLFNQTTGVPPSVYITGLRMRHACELLQNTDLNVKQISLLVGYADPHFFSKVFKANVKLSPQEYRKKQS